ncbi:MAG: zinc ribbon domain-containing protein [Anaerolineales bacterium]|nr:zinc ribbon domain-containing protein [Anaerolineales bacterium]
MTTKIYHGKLTAATLAKAISTRFSDEDLIANYTKSENQYIVRIASRAHAQSGGKTAIGVVLQQLEDGVAVKIGKQDWIGIAASLGISALSVRRNPLSLLGRLDDIAQDIENLTLDDRLWTLIDEVASTMNASQRLSEKLRRNKCEFCGTANPVGTPRCIACGAPQGDNQPVTCLKCGFLMTEADLECTNCGAKLK